MYAKALVVEQTLDLSSWIPMHEHPVLTFDWDQRMS